MVRLCLCSVSDSPGCGRSPSVFGVVVVTTFGVVVLLSIVVLLKVKEKSYSSEL